MGQKVNPNGFRFGITKQHNATWFATKNDFAKTLVEDQIIRALFEDKVREYAIGKIEILRNQSGNVVVKLHTAKPGVVIGEQAANLKKLVVDIKKAVKNKDFNVSIQAVEIEKPELNARLVAEEIAIKLENRGSFRAAQKFVIRDAFKAGAKGIKTQVSGRLNGVDMARSEGYSEGEMRLHTLRQDVDFAMARANTTYGVIGVKVWISKGEILDGGKR